VRHQAQLDRSLAEFGERALERLSPERGEAIVDVGCGCGATSLSLARSVGSQGRVLGIDVSGPMLDRARERVREAALSHVSFLQADAETHLLPVSHYDALFSRFGIMFFQDPEAAFTNLKRGLRPGGRLVAICWRAVDENPWLSAPMGAVRQHLNLGPPPEPHAPGPFAFAEPERLFKVLTRAGFREVALEAIDGEMVLAGGESLEEVIQFFLEHGAVKAHFLEQPAQVQARVIDSLRSTLEPHAGPRGVVSSAAAWIVHALA